MAYTYRNKKTGEVIYLNRRAKSAFWEEVEPEKEEIFEGEKPEEENSTEPEPEKMPKKTAKSRGK
ncbi:MAG: hypothetical protein IKB09_09710 [Oscillospiraceae bacterium]|nr:hypothetical protein [Oscillospiraceae bacterium]MBR6595168.1 hypothetical protein [Oscillospiraceae bacterium]